jgi:N-acetylmuramate 1-kinase
MSEAPRSALASERDAMILCFLDRAGWTGAELHPLAGDASNRRYLRLFHPEHASSAVLMDAPPERGEDVRPFLRVARHLSRLGLSVPSVLAEEPDDGLLLLEDLGDGLFARICETQPDLEPTLYTAAIDLLLALHRHPVATDFPVYDFACMGDRAALALDWYASGSTAPDTSTRQRAAFAGLVAELCASMAAGPSVVALRDFHAENLIWLPGRTGVANVGLLDFQDAALAHPAYDLVSLLQDARREMSSELQGAMIARYLAATNLDRATFDAALACLGAQRNLRILGVFARLCLRDGKPGYLRHVPRVWAHLMEDLAHPALAPLRAEVARLLPEPTPSRLRRIAERCPTSP